MLKDKINDESDVEAFIVSWNYYTHVLVLLLFLFHFFLNSTTLLGLARFRDQNGDYVYVCMYVCDGSTRFRTGSFFPSLRCTRACMTWDYTFFTSFLKKKLRDISC